MILRTAAGALMVLASGAAASAATYTVTSTADSGPGSLRQAILDANSRHGSDEIVFAIPGTGVRTIAPLSELSAVTDTVTIDGYTQPGSRPNDLPDADDAAILVDLDGVSAPAGARGLVVQHDGCTVRGLAVHGFHPLNGSTGGVGILILGGACAVTGNFVGVDPSGLVADGNTEGVSVVGDGNRIGGLAPADRNLIGASINAVGLRFSGNAGVIQGNFIGVDATGEGNVGCHGAGIVIGGQGDTIGGSTSTAANRIAFNGGAIVVPDKESAGIAILRNSIFGNSGDARGVGGIDLGYDGVSPNDACDFDAGTNGFQNFPVLGAARADGDGIEVDFTLDSAPSTAYRIDFFASRECDASGNGQGEQWIGRVFTTTGGGCSVSGTASLKACLEGDFVVTATATNPANDTSEFSACVPLTFAPRSHCRQIVPVTPSPPRAVRPRP